MACNTPQRLSRSIGARGGGGARRAAGGELRSCRSAAAAAAPGALPCADSVARLKLDLHATLCAAFGKNGSAARGAADCEFGEVDEGPVAVGHRRYRRRRRRKKPPAAEDGVT